MTNVSPLERAEQQVKGFEHTYSIRHGQTYARNLFYLACHAALPAAISVDFLHLLRINFFFENTEQLPYTAEADLLLSPLCTEIGDELYEMDHEVRDILLQKLIDRYGRERLSEVAKLLWQYDRRFAPWADREMLERAQQLTALSFADPAHAREWLAQQSPNDYSLEQKVWFTAVNQEVLLAEKVILPPDERPRAIGVEEPAITEGDQTQLAPVKGERPERADITVSPPDVSHIETSEEKQPKMSEEPEAAYEPSLSQEPPADPSITGAQASSEEVQQILRMNLYRLRYILREAIVRAFTIGELEVLCYDLAQNLRLDGINVSVSPEILEGTSLREKVQSLINYCERHGILEPLIRTVLHLRPNLTSMLLETEQELPSNAQSSTSEDGEPSPVDKEKRIPRELHNRLVRLLLQVPGMEDFKTRDGLLAGIPNRESIFFHRTESLRADIYNLVDQLSMWRLQNGQWALLVFIDNVILFTGETATGEQLKELRGELEAFYAEVELVSSLIQEQSPEAPPSQKRTGTSVKTINKLIDALLAVPDIDDPATRAAVLATIPNHQNFPRDYDNARNDLLLIVSALAPLTDRYTGEKLLKIFIENVQSRVRSLTLYDRLEQLYHQYEMEISKG